ncbi:uncharacterized protein MONOS_18076 [Monocercomonoides exilis]|uniref:uncharacterized protein n=1 Tax=Monocercomonoides exilis TaxID=2049356 RepID=UPI00355A689B|nr:hypothetical protein MONOS_18076 [Monocercomonoides exilis]
MQREGGGERGGARGRAFVDVLWTRLSFSGQGMEAEVKEDGKKECQAQHFALGVWGWIRDKDGARMLGNEVEEMEDVWRRGVDVVFGEMERRRNRYSDKG